MKSYIYKVITLLAILSIGVACEFETQVDPNNPSLGGVESNASKATLQGLVTGLEARHRGYFTNATQMFGSFGREVWAFFGSDPRFINDWLGRSGTTYPDFFASNGTYLTPYQAVKQANTLISSASTANNSNVSAEESAGYSGFAKTVKAHQLIWPWLQQWDNGIRVEVDKPLEPGPILDRAAALTAIRVILDEGRADLLNAGSEFSFELTAGWAGYDTPAGMLQVNRALAARFAIYAGDYAGAIAALNESFFDINDARSVNAMMTGPMHVYGEAPDLNNPLFYPLDANTNTILIVHPSMVEDAIAGDARANKFYERAEPVINANLGADFPGEYQDNRWPSNTDPIPFVRNEELILIKAEAEWFGGDKNVAIQAIDNIRNTWGIGNTAVTAASTDDEFVEELLVQRRYSLWAEGGHRWVDLRRFNRLTDTYIDLRDGGTIFTQVAQRQSEITWEQEN